MATDRLAVVLASVAQRGAAPGTVVDHVCAAAVDLMALTGAGLSLMIDAELRIATGVTDPSVTVLQELQLTLGEGPCIDATLHGSPVTEPDMARPRVARWPAFGSAATQAGLRAVFAFPLRFGAFGIGVLALYRDHPGELTADQYAYGVVLADVATHVVLGLQAGAPAEALHVLLADKETYWAEVHQATGMVSVQLSVTLEEAFLRLRALSFSQDRSLRLVSADVVARTLRLRT
jgi:GAF domain